MGSPMSDRYKEPCLLFTVVAGKEVRGLLNPGVRAARRVRRRRQLLDEALMRRITQSIVADIRTAPPYGRAR